MSPLNKAIEHTLLKPTATKSDILKLCNEAIENQFIGVCVSPYYVELASKILDKTDVKVCTVIGFPFGYDHIATKIDAINRAVDAGADELDAVVNLSAVKSENWDLVESEIDSLTTTTRLKKGKSLKLILETSYLNDEEIIRLCNLCVKYNVDFAKTSTGYSSAGATVAHVTLMKNNLSNKVAIKASGGIKDADFANQLIEAGATRLGTSSGIKIISK